MKTKLCPKCNQTLFIKDFYKRGAKENRRPSSYCKKCFSKLCMERWKQKKIEAVKTMGDMCFDCKTTYPYPVYDFHHLYGKDYEWDKLRLRSQKSISNELQKCVLLCSNCHRIRHMKKKIIQDILPRNNRTAINASATCDPKIR